MKRAVGDAGPYGGVTTSAADAAAGHMWPALRRQSKGAAGRDDVGIVPYECSARGALERGIRPYIKTRRDPHESYGL